MFVVNFQNYDSDYDVFAALAIHFKNGIRSRRTIPVFRKTDKIEEYIIERLKGGKFDHLKEISAINNVKFEIYFKKKLVYIVGNGETGNY